MVPTTDIGRESVPSVSHRVCVVSSKTYFFVSGATQVNP